MFIKQDLQSIADFFNCYITLNDNDFILWEKKPTFNTIKDNCIKRCTIDTTLVHGDCYPINKVLVESRIHKDDLVLCWNVEGNMPNIRKFLCQTNDGFSVYNSSISYQEKYTHCVKYDESIVTNLEVKNDTHI